MNGTANPQTRHVPLLQQQPGQPQNMQQPHRMNGHPIRMAIHNQQLPPFPPGRSPPNIESNLPTLPLS